MGKLPAAGCEQTQARQQVLDNSTRPIAGYLLRSLTSTGSGAAQQAAAALAVLSSRAAVHSENPRWLQRRCLRAMQAALWLSAALAEWRHHCTGAAFVVTVLCQPCRVACPFLNLWHPAAACWCGCGSTSDACQVVPRRLSSLAWQYATLKVSLWCRGVSGCVCCS